MRRLGYESLLYLQKKSYVYPDPNVRDRVGIGDCIKRSGKLDHVNPKAPQHGNLSLSPLSSWALLPGN